MGGPTPPSASRREYNRSYRKRNAESLRAKGREYYEENRKQRLEYARNYLAANKDEINRKVREHQRHRRRLERVVVFSWYGTECACCGSVEDLTIDHIIPTGKAKSQAISVFYRWLIAAGFPEGFQTLCRSCNSSKKKGTMCLLHMKEVTC